ncbi:MAG: S8 family serine peptidase [Pyrinomonadaceae bacterium]
MKRYLVILPLVIVVFALAYVSVPVEAGPENEKKFFKAENAIPNEYVVVFKQGIRVKDVEKFAKKLAKDNKGRILSIHQWLKSFGVEITEKDAIKISKDENVEFVEENSLVSVAQSSCPNSSATLPGHYGVDRLDQRYLPRDGSYCPTRTGRGVNVFVIDTGIWPTHDDFKNPDGSSRAINYGDVTGGNGLDCNNHGTFVSSTVGGNLYGVAKEANIYSVKVTSGCGGSSSPNFVSAGINAAINSGLPNKVINISINGSPSLTMDNAVRNAVNNYGIPVVVGAGNNNVDAGGSSPARVWEAITVGASDMSNTNYGAANVTEYRWWASNYGPVVDLFAPGGPFVGSAASGYFSGSNSGYDGYSGTSAAAPHVAGIAAMYLETNPGAPPYLVQQAIVGNATTGLLLDTGPGSPNRIAYSNFLAPSTATVQFASSSYAVSEGTASVLITVTRTGSTANPASVQFSTTYSPHDQCNATSGVASQKCDFDSAYGTLRFAAGESSKTFSMLIIDDGYVEGTEAVTIQLGMPSGVDLGAQYLAQLTITDNDAAPSNPIGGTPFFVRQQYYDFLNREPDPPGLAAWINIIDTCGQPGGVPPPCDRIEVSSAFYRSAEFQGQGSIVYRYYSGTLGYIPDYVQFFTDLSRISGFQTEAEREANKVRLFDDWTQRPDFAAQYGALNSTQYVDQLAGMTGVSLWNRDQLINDLNTGQKTRAQVLRDVIEFNSAVNQACFNEAFVVMEYFGYLRRQPDGSYIDWLNYLNSSGDYRGMINGFMNSAEYVLRFGP